MRLYYKILEVDETATQAEIKTSYRRLSKIWHPDKHQNYIKKTESGEKHGRISEAYAVLGNAEKRIIYDKYGIDCSLDKLDKSANEKVVEVFKDILKVNFVKDTLFSLTQRTVKICINELELVQEASEREILKFENKITLLQSIANDKIDESMVHLSRVTEEEIQELESEIIKIDIQKIDLDIIVHKKAYDILKQTYPKEEEPEQWHQGDHYRLAIEGYQW